MTRVDGSLSSQDVALIERYADNYYLDNSYIGAIKRLILPSKKHDSTVNIFQNHFDFRRHHFGRKGDTLSDIAAYIVGIAVVYFFVSIPEFYRETKNIILTGKVEKISKKNVTDINEKKVVGKLKTLIKAEKSLNYVRSQKIKAFSVLGIIGSAVTGYMAEESVDINFDSEKIKIVRTSANIAENSLNFAKNLTPKFLIDFIKKNKPSSLDLSKIQNKTIELLSDKNLVSCAKYTAIASIGLLTLNSIYNIYKDFYDDAGESKKDLSQKAAELKIAVNVMKGKWFPSLI